MRYSLTNPAIYLKYNVDGFLNILEYCRKFENTKLVYASSSSVYGGNKKVPFSVFDEVSNPVSLYAVTKRTNELMAQSYARFFTVYGPWGRPDMAIWKFTDAIFKKKPIQIFNNGKLSRDFTYIDDVIDGVERSLDYKFKRNDKKHLIFNLGNSSPVAVNEMVRKLEKIIGIKAKKKMMPMQLGDVKNTYADIGLSKKKLNYCPKTSLEDGLSRFVNWFKIYKN